LFGYILCLIPGFPLRSDRISDSYFEYILVFFKLEHSHVWISQNLEQTFTSINSLFETQMTELTKNILKVNKKRMSYKSYLESLSKPNQRV
jgi:hypothetical protein